MNRWQRLIRGSATDAEVSVCLLTRQGCCLCDEAKQVLTAQGLTVTEVDIDDDPELRERYTDCVPVVLVDGKERFRGRVDPVLLRRLLEGRRRAADATDTTSGQKNDTEEAAS